MAQTKNIKGIAFQHHLIEDYDQMMRTELSVFQELSQKSGDRALGKPLRALCPGTCPTPEVVMAVPHLPPRLS